MVTWPLLLVLACSGGGGTTYDDPAQCEGMAAGAERDECWAATAPALFAKDPVAAEQIIVTQVEDPKVRDFIWLTVTREIDPGSTRWCEKIQEAALAERCKVLVSRPHLHRALQQERGQSPGVGGPPPGGPPGGGPGAGPPPAGGPPPGAPGMPPPGAGDPPPGAPLEGPPDGAPDGAPDDRVETP